MPKHLYLPELDGGSIGEPPEAGLWHGYERRVLRDVSDGIAVGPGDVARGVSSVPDAWARPLLVQSALRRESGHPMRARLVQEWRGLLSLLALHRLQQYRVDAVPLVLADAAGEAAREFVRALTRLLPAPVALERDRPRYEWSDALLVRYEGIPVGAVSPTTLVYPGADYHRRLARTTLSLKDGDGYLAPPSADQRDELLYVAEWAEQLRDRLNAPGNPRAAVLDSATSDPAARDAVRLINGLLDEWLDELRATFRVRPGDPFGAANVEVDPDPLEVRPSAALLDRYRVYRELLRPLRRPAGAAGAPHSDLLLDAARNRSGRAHVVVVTPNLLRGGGTVWGARRLAHLGGDAERAVEDYFPGAWGERVDQQDLKPHNAIWVRPEKYFLADTLTVTGDRSALLAEPWWELNGERHLLLPFTPQLLDFFSPAEVRERLHPEYKESSDGVTFSFQLPIAGRAAERVQKTYRHRNAAPGEGLIRSLDAPPVQIFPRYVAANWRRYYVLQGDAGRVTVRPVVPASCATAERTHRSPESGAEVRAVEISGDGAFPEALVFAPAGRPDEPLGLALVPRPPEPPGLARHWRVGVDFGTSNTNVFRYDASSDTAEPWRFDFERYVWPVTAPAAERDAALRDYFVPTASVDLPVPTALRVFQDATKEHPLLDYFVYFTTRYALPDDVYADIKWDSEEKQQTKYFLESLLLLLLVEVGLSRVKTVTLACSYPKAFSPERLGRYKGEWEEVVRKLLDDDRCVVRRRAPHEPNRPDVLELTDKLFGAEGVAAGEFFASKRTNGADTGRERLRIAGVCLDVGGGSTDVSIWHDRQIVYDASVLLAGRQVSHFLQANSRVLDALLSPDAVAALAPKRREPAAFASRLNVILKREEGLVRERLIEHANVAEVQWFRRILAVEFGAIAFYTAALIGAVDRKLGGALGAELEPGGVSLYWGGNAAKLINWIDFGRYDPAGIASKMLNALLFQALKELPIAAPSARLAQKQSPGHKSEAAGGLVVMANLADRASARDVGDDEYEMTDGSHDPLAGGVVCGENVELADGRRVGYLDVITERMLFDGGRTRFRRTSLDRLGRFLDIVNHFGVRFGLFTDATKVVLDAQRRGEIADAVRAHFIEAQDVPEGQREIEPVFVLEVTKLLELMHAGPR